MSARISSLRNGIDPVSEQSRDDLVSGDVVVVSSLDAATTYDWALVFVPEGSTATFSGVVTAVSPGSFTVDQEGAYLVRLVVDASLGTESTQYVRLRALTAFGELTLIAAGERRDGTGIIPVDVDAEGWANEQNANLQVLKAFVKPMVASGRILFVDANDGTDNYADFTTVQAAITSATTTGASEAEQWVIAVRPGRYVETATFVDWIHVIGWPGNPDATMESAILEGLQTANITAGSALIANLHLENNADSATATLTKTGAGTLRLRNSRLESNGTLAGQGAALDLQVGLVDAVDSSFMHLAAGAADRVGYTQTGANTTSRFDRCLFMGPSAIDANPALVVGVIAVFVRSRTISSHATGVGISSVAQSLDYQNGSVESVSGDGIIVNPTASVFLGAVTLTVCFSDVQDDITFDTTNLGGVTTLNLGSVKYTTLVFPGGAVTSQVALTQSKTHYYDDTIHSLGADNVQDAIDFVAATAAISPLTYNKNIPEVPNDAVSYRGWVPVACTLIAVRVRMMTVNLQGNYTLAVTNEGTASTVLSAATFDMNTLVDGVIQPVTLTGTAIDLDFATLDGWKATLTSDDPNFDGSDIYLELVFNPATGAGLVTEDLATTLLIGNTTGGTNIAVTSGDIIQFGNSVGAAISAASTGRIRYNDTTKYFQTSVDGGAWLNVGPGATPFVHKNVPPLPNNTFRYEGWSPVNAVVTDISVAMATINTMGNYSITVTNVTTGNTMLVGATFDMNTLVAATPTALTLTGSPSDLNFSVGDEWAVELTSDNLAFDGVGIYWSMLFGNGGAITTSSPDDDSQFEMAVNPNNTVSTLFFAPYNLTIVGVKVYGQTAPTTAGVYTLAVEDLDGAVTLLSAATFDMTSLVAATLTTMTLTATTANLDLAAGTRVRAQLVSDNADLVAEGVYLQLIYRSQ